MYISVLNKDDAIKYTPQASLKNMQDIQEYNNERDVEFDYGS